MATTTRVAREREAARRQIGVHMEVDSAPDAQELGAESAEYLERQIDPQWMMAYKLFADQEGEYGVPVRVPKGQYFEGGANSLEAQRRSDGSACFTLLDPARILGETIKPRYACFVDECRKMCYRRIDLVKHVRAFHFDEADLYREILTRIEKQVADEDPRLQALLRDLGGDTREDSE